MEIPHTKAKEKRVDAPNTNGERLFLQSYMNNCAADHTTQ